MTTAQPQPQPLPQPLPTADAPKRYVFLDPDGCGGGWVFVIVAAPTGVVYQNQCGGYSCDQYEQEGYLVPLYGADPDEELRKIFVGELKGWGHRGRAWSPEVLERVRAAVRDFGVYGSGGTDEPFPPSLVLDESRLAEAAEAWLPVLTPDGPGVLVWENSD